ncbi:MAG: hypothetical protein ACOCT9_00590 [archaeon]
MPAPVVSWYNADNDTQETAWDIGVVDAGSVSDDKTFLIWNNRDGSEDVSDMEECTITTKDAEGGDVGDLIEETWIEAQCDSAGEDSFTPIGGTDTHPIEAGGGDAGKQEILGGTNDGSLDDGDNYAEVTVHANVPSDANAGTIEFLLRVSYQYT